MAHQLYGKAQMIRKMNLLAIKTDLLAHYCYEMDVPHKAPWDKYSREELIEKLKNYVWLSKFDGEV